MVTSRECFEKWGDPTTVHDEGSYMVLWNVPEYIWQNIPAIPRRIYCNRQMLVALEVAFLNIIERGLADEMKTWDGCFNIRPIRGYANVFKRYWNAGNLLRAMDYMSTHGWGISIDINAAWNQLGKKPRMRKELAQCFIDAGFDWGGDWKRPDGMHFQLSYLTK